MRSASAAATAARFPIMFFVLGAVLSSMGPGNIATAALLAPLAMATAARVGIPLFLMAIMVGNGANSGALSPFAPTGIIVNGIMAKNGLPGLELQTYLYNLLAHALVAFSGYALFGGLKLFVARARAGGCGRRRASVEAPPDPVRADAFDRRHWITLADHRRAGLSVIVAKVNVGMAAFAGAVVLVLSKSADDGEAIKRMPWRVIVMVCGVTVLIAPGRAGAGHRSARVAGRRRRRRRARSPASSRCSPGSSRSTAARPASSCRPSCRWCPAWRPRFPAPARSPLRRR